MQDWIKRLVPDTIFLELKFRKKMGTPLDLKAPKTFNEKIQWLKLHDHNPVYTKMVDKYEVKQYISEIVGTQYTIPTYGIWDNPDNIDFDTLPSQFVLKCTHDCGGVVICKDKNNIDIMAIKEEMKERLKKNYYWAGREWPYKDIKPRIFAEQLLSDEFGNDVKDYKLWCFNGEPLYTLVCTDRFKKGGLREDFFDNQWHHMNIKRPGILNCEYEISCPTRFLDMIKIAKQISEGIPFVRIDFYETNEGMYVGEITFYPASGFKRFLPEEWDYKFGKLLNLPTDY